MSHSLLTLCISLTNHLLYLIKHSADLLDFSKDKIRMPDIDQHNHSLLVFGQISCFMLIRVIKDDHLTFFPGSWISSNHQVGLFWYEKREVTSEFEVASTVVGCDGSLWGHCREEGVAEGRASHQLGTDALLKQLSCNRTVLLEELLVNLIASLDVVHPLPCSLVKSMLPILLRVVICIFSVSIAQLPILLFHLLYIAFKILSKAEIIRLVIRLRVQTWEVKEARSWPMVDISS